MNHIWPSFAHPQWLWALLFIPLGFIWSLYWVKFGRAHYNNLTQFIDPKLLPHLLLDKKSHQPQKKLGWLYALLVFFIVLALANPRWTYKDIEAFTPSASMVIMLDLSASMNATDISPSRIVRARQYIEDLLNQTRGLKIGLIGFAGHAHLISPITDDIQTIKTYVPALDTDLTNVQGNSLHKALRMSADLLSHEPGNKKSILLISDGNVGSDDFSRELSSIHGKGIQVHVVGVGTKTGAPFRNKNGTLHKVQGKVVTSRLNDDLLKDIAKRGSGVYTEAGYFDVGLRTILAKSQQSQDEHVLAGKVRQWDDRYYLFLIPGAMILLYLMRTRALYMLVIACITNSMVSHDVAAFELPAWLQNSEQRGQKLYVDGNFKAAADTFKDPYHKGVALYRGGDFAQAEAAFKEATRPDIKVSGMYNTGNAQMQQQKWQDAISSYEAVLAIEPEHFAAAHNLEIARKMLQENPPKDNDCECNNKDKQQNNSAKNDKSQDKQNDSRNAQDQKQEQNQTAKNDQEQNQTNADKQAQAKSAPEQQDRQSEKEQQPASAQPAQAMAQDLNADEARMEQLLNRVDSDIKVFLKNKFYIEDIIGAQ